MAGGRPTAYKPERATAQQASAARVSSEADEALRSAAERLQVHTVSS